MKNFVLERNFDVSGVSGIGVVAEGTEFENGKVIVAWKKSLTVGVASVVIYDSIADLEKIHGHGGATNIVWI